MPRYLVEAYVPRAPARAAGAPVGLLLEVAREMTGEGAAVRVIRQTSIPDDDTCFYVVEADSIKIVRELCIRARLESARAVEAFEHPSD